MKRSMILACVLAVGLMLSVNLNTGIASSDSIIPTKRKAASMPAQRVAPVGKTSTSTLKAVIIKAAITDLQIGTGPTGGWFWQATVKNTGNTPINGRDFTVQGLKKSFPAPQNNWTPASGSIISTTVIAPNQSVVVKRNWTRCCQTDQLKVDLRRASNNTVMDTKLLTNLLKNPAQNIPVDVRVKRIDWDSNTKKWRATLKNHFSIHGEDYRPGCPLAPRRHQSIGGRRPYDYRGSKRRSHHHVVVRRHQCAKWGYASSP